MERKYEKANYDFLFEEKKKVKKINGVEIAIIILGAFSIFFSFGTFLLTIICAGIGLLLSKAYITTTSSNIGKIGYMFCKIGICLAPSMLLLNIVLNVFGVIATLSIFPRLFTIGI